EQIAGATSDHVVVIWDANTGEILHTLEHDDVVLSVAWSPDGNKLASTSTNADSGLRIWDTTSWNVLTTLPSKFGTVSWNPNGNELAVGEYLFVKVLDAESGQEIISLPTDK